MRAILKRGEVQVNRALLVSFSPGFSRVFVCEAEKETVSTVSRVREEGNR
jgi:hypothetical protein